MPWPPRSDTVRVPTTTAFAGLVGRRFAAFAVRVAAARARGGVLSCRVTAQRKPAVPWQLPPEPSVSGFPVRS